MLRTNRVEEMFKNGLTHRIADVLLTRVFSVLPLLTTAEVEHLGYVVQYQPMNCHPVPACVTIDGMAWFNVPIDTLWVISGTILRPR